MRNKIRSISIIMSLLLAFTFLPGCSGGKNNSSELAVSTKTIENTASETSKTDESVKLKEPATIIFKTYHSPYEGDENYENTAVGQMLKDKLNITLKILPSKSDGLQDLLVDTAANDLPDIMSFWANSDYLKVTNKAANEGLLAEIGDSLNYSKVAESALDKNNLSQYQASYIYSSDLNGKAFYLPTWYYRTSPWISGFGLNIRGDVADKLGIQTPTTNIKTEEDLYNLLLKIKQSGITDINGKPAYPLGVLWFFAVINRPFDFGGKDGIGVENGKINLTIATDYTWKRILWNRKLVKEGLIDPESYTQTYETACEKIAQGKYIVQPAFALHMLPDGTPYMKTLTDAHPDMVYKPLGNLLNSTGDDMITLNKGMESGLALAFKKNTNLEAAMKLVDFFCSKEGRAVAAFGKSEEQWTWNDKGFAQMTPSALEAFSKDAKAYDQKNGTGNTFPLGMLAGVGGLDVPELNAFGAQGDDYYFQNNQERAKRLGDLISANMPKRTVINKLSLSGLIEKYPQKDKIKPVLGEAENLINQCILVDSEKEAKSLYDKYIKQLTQNGLQDYITYLQAEYDKNPDLYATYVTE